MEINWSIFAVIAAPILALFVGAVLSRLFERRPKLIAYFSHASAFDITGYNPVRVHTHGIVLQNAGKKPATDIRVRHNHLPEYYKVFPEIEYQVNNLSGGGAELVIPTFSSERAGFNLLYVLSSNCL